MKKIFIGLAVFATLVVYSISVRHEQPKLSAPSSLTASNTPNGGSGSTNTVSRDDEGISSGSGGDGTSGGSPSSLGSNSQSSSQSNTKSYKDGSYTGSTEDAYYGNVQVKATISGSRITDITFLQYPNTHSTSVYINNQAMPYLQQEAIKAQNSNVNIVSGATYTSQAFIQSLSNALSQAS